MPLVAREDPVAFEVFYDRHAGAAFSLAYRIVGTAAQPRTSTQEALHLDLAERRPLRPRARKRPRLDSRDRPEPGDRPASQARPVALRRLVLDSEELLEQKPADELTDSEALRRETAREVRGALSDLPDDQSRVIQLAYLRRLQPLGDRGDAERAAGDDQGAHASGNGQDPSRAGGGVLMARPPGQGRSRRLLAGRPRAGRGEEGGEARPGMCQLQQGTRGPRARRRRSGRVRRAARAASGDARAGPRGRQS